MTSVKPLSCREDNNEGSWNTKTVTTSVAVRKEHKIKVSHLLIWAYQSRES